METYLPTVVVMFSMFAAWFWTISATGRPLQSAWRSSTAELTAEERAHWNKGAALCASIAAVAQAITHLHTLAPCPCGLF